MIDEPGLRGSLDVAVLMYHSVSAEVRGKFRPFSVEPLLFEEHMATLADHGCHVMSVAQLIAFRSQHDFLPERTVVLTFDDAFTDFHEAALPVLVRHGFDATLYVPTGYVGGTSTWLWKEGQTHKPVLSWAGLAEIAASGIEVGSHSHSHPHLDLVGAPMLRYEIVDSRTLLEDRLQQEVTTFAYPYGHHTRKVREAVRGAGYQAACAVSDLPSHFDDDRFTVKRMTVTHGMTVETLLNRIEVRRQRLALVRSRIYALASRSYRRALLSPSTQRPGGGANRDHEGQRS
jgi:peptidoglycan/xylan/chitin deacetylase (PgdA/CDA1 family)